MHTEREKGGKGVERKSEAGGEEKWLPTPVFTFFVGFLHFPKTLPCRLAVTLVPHAEIRLAKGEWIIYMGLPFRIKVSTMRLPQCEQKGTGELRANTLWATNTGTHIWTQKNWCKAQRGIIHGHWRPKKKDGNCLFTMLLTNCCWPTLGEQ